MTETAGNISQQDQVSTTTQIDLIGLLTSITIESVTWDNLQETLEQTLSQITDHFKADHGYIMMKDKEDSLQPKAAINRGQQEEGLFTASNALMEKVVNESSGLIVRNAMNSDLLSGDPDFQRYNIGSAICVPISTSDSLLGLLYLDSTSPDTWDQSNMEPAKFIGRHMGMALNNLYGQKLFEENKRLIAAGKATLNLSHSVKNILQMIGGAAEVVDFGLRGNQIHRVKRSWDILKPNLERMRKYILEMLDYSKERKLNLGPCDFNRVIQSAIESLKSQLKQKNSKINIRVDQKMPAIELDSERIHEMALNIILNAIDIVDDSGGLVSIETKYHTDEQLVSLIVTDNGPGMSKEMKEKIFTPFESDKKKLGTGLGMAIAKQIIDQHKGRIEIESLSSRGTTFTIYFPAITPSQTEDTHS